MFKMIQGNVQELEGLLNAAAKEGYTELFREFPPPFLPLRIASETDVDNLPPKPDVFSFLMKKPSPPPDMGNMMREVMVSLGLGDRLGPPPDLAPVLDLVRKPPSDE